MVVDEKQPRMLATTQIEAHVSRLTSVREGLRKYEAEDGRAKDAGIIIEAAIAVLSMDSFPPLDEVAREPLTFEIVSDSEEALAEQVNQSTTEPDQPRLDHPAY